MRAAVLSGIISLLAAVPVLAATRNTTGMKIAVTAVELIVDPRPQTTSIKKINRRLSLLPARAVNQSPKPRATPVRTNPSPMTKRAAIKTIFESLKPTNPSPIVITPVNGKATSIISATASIRGLLIANMTIAAAKRSSTTISSILMAG